MQQQLLYQSLGLFLVSLAPPVLSFSRGAGHSACQDLRPGHIRAHPQDPQKSYVTLRTSSSSYRPGQLVTVTVRSSKDFMGFLLQARRVDGSGVRDSDGSKAAPTGAGPVVVGGSWALVPPGTHTLRCLSEGDTLTHSDKQLKRNLSFVWKAPNEPIGDVRFYITVVQSYFVYWAGIESEVVKDKSRPLWRRSDGIEMDGSRKNTIPPDLWFNTKPNNILISATPSMSTQNQSFSKTATEDVQISSTTTATATRNAHRTVGPFTILTSHQRESKKNTNETYTVVKDSSTGKDFITKATFTRTDSPFSFKYEPTSAPSFLALEENKRDDIEGLNPHNDSDLKDKTQNPEKAWEILQYTTLSAFKTYQTSHDQTSKSKLEFLTQENNDANTPSKSDTSQTVDTTSSRTSSRTYANLFTVARRSTDKPTNIPKHSNPSSQIGTDLSSTRMLQHSDQFKPNTAHTLRPELLLQSNPFSQQPTSPSLLGLLLQTSSSLYKKLPKQNTFQTNQPKSATAEIDLSISPDRKSHEYTTDLTELELRWNQAESTVVPRLASLLDTTSPTNKGRDIGRDQSSHSSFTSRPIKMPQFSTTEANRLFSDSMSTQSAHEDSEGKTRSAFSTPPTPSPIARPPVSPQQQPFFTPSSRPTNGSSTPSVLPSFSPTFLPVSLPFSTRVLSSSSPYRSSSKHSIPSTPSTIVTSKETISSLAPSFSFSETPSTSIHAGPSPALRRAHNNPSQTQTNSGSATPKPEVHLNPKPHPNLNPKSNVNPGNNIKSNAPKVDTKPPPKPFETPDTGGTYPDITSRHSPWEVGMLLGCSVGLGMMLVFGVRYVYRQACGKRTEVTLRDRERRYATGERGLIHVQECGDLVRVRRLRENSFVLLAEYDILAGTGD